MIRTNKGPFAKRPFFEKDEIDTIASDELRMVGLLPEEPAPIRIERFIEKSFGIVPTYQDLPSDLLGFTRFTVNGCEEIVVSKALSEEGSDVAERRLNSTLAHEAGHALLHSQLFADLHRSTPTKRITDDVKINRKTILCRKVTEGVSDSPGNRSNYDGQWWEYQANLMIGTLLIPRPLLRRALVPVLSPVGMLGFEAMDPGNRDLATSIAASVFEVNPVVARIRVDEVFPPNSEGQLTL